jgi:hypothetical protein
MLRTSVADESILVTVSIDGDTNPKIELRTSHLKIAS